ncbi:FAD-dependent oxidoreductase [Blastococcus sp. PRF04-17]|uniref:FAD-dependent oxidoreductase n=1 Tax=Blastococcus sp. PRF04-17 TaxID=2933797 RepID=UPI00353044C8
MHSRETDRTYLSPERRRADRARLESEVVDVLVIGGGVTGAGAALDAASRGLTVALVEARDWASGTSSRSSKLIHGGLRYLEQFAFPWSTRRSPSAPGWCGPSRRTWSRHCRSCCH